jgi:DNA-binding response OmpR family regulator
MPKECGMERLLVIDDDAEVCRFLTNYLEPEGFVVDVVHDGETGLERLGAYPYDLAILDIMLPQISGMEVLRRLRKDLNTPVIILTGCSDEIDTVFGLEIGADDYVIKPFKPRELLARIRAVLRRAPGHSQTTANTAPHARLVVGDIEMHTSARLVFCGEEQIHLTTLEFDLLEMLLRNAGQTVLRNDLKRIVLGRQPDPYDRSIDVHISRLRRKLGHQLPGTTRIQTIRNAGYLYSAPPHPEDAQEIPSTHRRANEMLG